jgi:high affinity Mn2+ porin
MMLIVILTRSPSDDRRLFPSRAFLFGDGGLTYGPEKIFEGFYTAHLWRGFFASFDLQRINNPGYNRARGPVSVPALRLHVDF